MAQTRAFQLISPEGEVVFSSGNVQDVRNYAKVQDLAPGRYALKRKIRKFFVSKDPVQKKDYHDKWKDSVIVIKEKTEKPKKS